MAHSGFKGPPDSIAGQTENGKNPSKVEKNKMEDKDMEGLEGRRVHDGYERGK